MHKSLCTESVPRKSHALWDLCITTICIVSISTVVATEKIKWNEILKKREKSEKKDKISYLILYTWAVNYWPILPSPPTSGLSILFWQGLVSHLLSMPSQSSHHMGFCFTVWLWPTLQVHRCVTYLDQLFITSISDVMHDEEYDLFICTSVTYPEQQAWVILAGNLLRVGYVH